MTATRPTRLSHLPRVAALHRATLPTGLFPRLGTHFLEAYHRSFVDGPHAVSRVAIEAGDAVGFVAGTVDARSHRDWVLRRHGARLAIRALVGLVTRPRVLLWFLRTRLGRYLRTVLAALPGGVRSREGDEAAGTPVTVGVLAHLAVAKQARGCGLGSRLTREFVDTAGARGSSELRLVTLAEGGAVEFYSRLGWQRLGRRTRDGRTLRELRRTPPES